MPPEAGREALASQFEGGKAPSNKGTGSDDASRQVDVAIAEYLEGVKRGAPPERDEFISRHKEVSAELEQFLDDHLALGQVAQAVLPESTAGAANSTGRVGTASRRPLAQSKRFGNFELIEEIARGGMGVVYKARQSAPSRTVALKMILAGQLASKADVDRFEVEAHAAAALDHPHIVPIFEVGEYEGQHYFTMALVEGESLAQRLASGPLSAKEAATIVRDVAIAVEYAHQRGVIHRDLKPANILLEADGRVRVTDFGLAKRQTEDGGLTRTGELLGTPSFMSPEQVAGDPTRIGPASDVYSLGATLYVLLTGRPPFQAASTVDTLKQVMDQDPVPPRELDASIPRDVETIALKCLEKSIDRRYESALALVEELNRFLEGRPIEARPIGRGEKSWRWCRRNPAVAVLAASVLTVLSAGIATSSYFAAASAREARAAKINLASARRTLGNMLEILKTQHDLVDATPEAVTLRKPLRDDSLRHLEPLSQEIEQRDIEAGEETVRLLDTVAYLQIEAGRITKGLQTSLHTIELARRLAKNDPTKEAFVVEMQINLGYYLLDAAYSKEKDVDLEAARIAGLEAVDEIERRALNTGKPPRVAVLYRSLALCAARSGDNAEALRLRRVGIERGEVEIEQTPNDVKVRRTFCNLLKEYGLSILKVEKDPSELAKAIPYFERANEQAHLWGKIESLEHSEKMDAQIAAAVTELNLGICRYRIDPSDNWEHLVRHAIDEFRKSPHPGAIPDAEWSQSVLVDQLRDSKRLSEAKAAALEKKGWLNGVAAGMPNNGVSPEQFKQWQGWVADKLRTVGEPGEAAALEKVVRNTSE